jgi:hypothetical protein
LQGEVIFHVFNNPLALQKDDAISPKMLNQGERRSYSYLTLVVGAWRNNKASLSCLPFSSYPMSRHFCTDFPSEDIFQEFFVEQCACWATGQKKMKNI